MIARISGEAQYRLADDSSLARINELEDPVIAAVDSGDEPGFASAYAALLDFVRSGSRVGEDELEPSDIILPPADLTFAEAGRDFTGEGLIPD